MTKDTDETPNLNPHFAEVIGFVAPDGTLQEAPSEKQFNLLINVGTEDDVKVNERVLVFGLGPPIKDPVDGRDLGCFEVVRGEGRVKSVQTRMAVVTSTSTHQELRRKPVNALASLATGLTAGEHEWVTVTSAFKNPQLGDKVRFI